MNIENMLFFKIEICEDKVLLVFGLFFCWLKKIFWYLCDCICVGERDLVYSCSREDLILFSLKV